MWVGGNLKDELSKIIIKIKLGGDSGVGHGG